MPKNTKIKNGVDADRLLGRARTMVDGDVEYHPPDRGRAASRVQATVVDPRPATAPDPRRWWALALLCGAFFMVILDAAIVNVALPSIQTDLGFSAEGLQWVISAYLLTFGGLLLLGGRAADLLGRRRMFVTGLVLFTIASLLSGLAGSAGMLIGARAFQGVGAAIMTPTALSIITTLFAEGPERNKALGIWGSLGGVGATAGWLIGGPLTDGPGWEWIFFINIPVGIVALVAARFLIPETRDVTVRRSFDPAGALTVAGGLALVVYAVVDAPDAGWGSLQSILLFALGGVLLASFAVIESRHPAPLLRLSLLRNRTIVGANAAMLLFGATAFGVPFALTLYAQGVLGYSAVKFGATSVVFPAMAAAASITGQALVLRVGYRRLAVLGMALLIAGSVLLTGVSADGSYFGDLFPGLVVLGLGVGFTFVTATIAGLHGIPERDTGLASGLSNTTFQIGGALGTAIVSTVLVSRTQEFTAANPDANPLVAMTEGFQSGFAAAIAFPVIGLVTSLFLFRRERHRRPRRAGDAGGGGDRIELVRGVHDASPAVVGDRAADVTSLSHR